MKESRKEDLQGLALCVTIFIAAMALLIYVL